MANSSLIYYLFSEFPGYWKGWTLAVLAVSETDARNYVYAWHRVKAKLIGKVKSGTVKAHCGGVTEAAIQVLRRKREQEECELL